MEKKETSSYQYSRASISPETAQAILDGNWSSQLIDSVETQTNAYFTPDLTTFGGAIYHPDGNGPEKPYYRPDEQDLTPQIQATAKIGIQYHYWDKLHQAILNQTIDLSKLFAMETLFLYPDENSSLSVDLIQYPAPVRRVAEKRNHLTPQYDSIIYLINCGGDADFWGPWENMIFPIEISPKIFGQIPGSSQSTSKEQLGISHKLSENTWQSWKTFHKSAGDLFHQSVVSCHNQAQLPNYASTILTQAIKSGEIIFSSGALYQCLVLNGITNINKLDDQKLLFPIDQTMKAAVTSEGESSDLLIRSTDLTQNLEEMYNTAKSHCQPPYTY